MKVVEMDNGTEFKNNMVFEYLDLHKYFPQSVTVNNS